MPIEKGCTKLIPKIYKHHAENIGLFFWIKAQLAIVPTVRIEQAILSYMKFTGITMDEWDIESASATYRKMQRDFFGDCKS
jgi:hypothetical protein